MKVMLTINPDSDRRPDDVVARLQQRMLSSTTTERLVTEYVVLDDAENTVLVGAENTTQRRGTALDHRPRVGDRMYYYGGRNEYHGQIVTITLVGDTYFDVDIPGWGASSGVRADCLSWHDRSQPGAVDTRRPVSGRTIVTDPPRVGDRLFYYGNTYSWHGRAVTVVRTTNVGGGHRQRWWVTFDDHPDDHRDNCPGTALRWNRR